MNDRLKEWAKEFIKHRDMFQKKLKEIKDTDTGFVAHSKDKDERFIVQETLDFDGIPKDENVCYVTMNNQKNFNKLLAEWKILVSFKGLKIIFVEKISTGKHWIVNPHIHDKISEKSSLKSGLKSLYDNVKNS